ncbi:MAG: phosphoribosylglycinamide formyltransferase, partial [Nitrospirae bacterium]|nr:phosphoribosylglycinamide formyltransferase [Nitrospirota bacterium]
MDRLSLGVLASGRGSNFQAIIDAIEAGRLNAVVKLLVVDNPNAFAVERAKKHSIEYLCINANEFTTKDDFFLGIEA